MPNQLSRTSGRGPITRRARGLAFVAAVVGSSGTVAPSEEPGESLPATQPPQISVGEPVTLPFGSPGTAPASRFRDPAAARQGEPRVVPRSGWLGMVVAESNVPGRWRIDDVAAGGPADLAGIRAGDELRAVDGAEPRNADEISQALTAITAGQTVLLAIGRESGVAEVPVKAAVRPDPPGSRFRAAGEAPLESVPPTTAPPVPTDPLPPAIDLPAVPTPPAIDTPSAPPTLQPPMAFQQPKASPPTSASQSTGASQPTSASPPAPAIQPPGTTRGLPADPGSRSQNPAFENPAFGPGGTAAPVQSSFTASSAGGRQVLGVRTIPIDPVIQARFQLTQPAGAYVVGLVHDLPAARAGVPLGSVIVALDRRPVQSPAELSSLVSGSPGDRPVTLRFLLPDGTSRDAAVRLQAIDPPLLSVLGGGDPVPAPEPRVARRPIEDNLTALRREIGALRDSLGRLEERLERLAPAGRR